MDIASRVEASMARARKLRAEGHLDAADDAAKEACIHASALPTDHPARAAAVWRALKVAFDRDDMAALAERLDDVAALEHPFRDHAPALSALEPLSQRWWDRRGYGHPALPRLWERWSEAWAEANDPWMAASGEVQLAWERACTGDLGWLRAAVERIARRSPRDFARGTSKHPLAEDAGQSVWFAQMQLAQVALRGAVWGADEPLARFAADVYADAVAEAGVAEDFWFLESVGRAEHSFGWRPDLLPRWAAAPLHHPRREVHLGLRDALLRPSTPTLLALRAALPAADAAGPEWGIDARRVLVAAGVPGADALAAEAAERIDRFGVRVFARG